MDSDWPQEGPGPDGPMAGGCPPGPHYAPVWSSDGGSDQVSQTSGKAGGLAPGGPLCPGR